MLPPNRPSPSPQPRTGDAEAGGCGGDDVSIAPALVTIAVGVLVERCKAQSRWIDFTWKPTGVLAGVPDAKPWTVLSQGNERATYYGGSAEIALYRTETGHYRDNLASGSPSLW